MVKFDQQLLIAARRLMTRANGHRLKELIFAYEQAVYLHNRKWPPHMIYQGESEQRLRGYVAKVQRELREQTPVQSTNSQDVE
jgi:hypothetical protein